MKKIIFFLVLMFVAIQFVEANRYHSHCIHRSAVSNKVSKKHSHTSRYASFNSSKKKYSGKTLARKRKQDKRKIAKNVSLSKGCPGYRKQLEIRKYK